MINTVMNKSLASVSLMREPESGELRTNRMPITPKAIEAMIKTFVAIFCMFTVYQIALKKITPLANSRILRRAF